MGSSDHMFSRILERYYSSMTPAEQRIADCLIQNPHENITLSVATLASRAQTSEATVVRFARTLGFKGFLELKSALLRQASDELASPQRYAKLSHPNDRRLIAAVADQEVQNIAQTVASVDDAAFEAISRALEAADVVYTLGSGGSSLLARLASYQLTLVGKRSLCLCDGVASFVEALQSTAGPRDLLWVFSFPPYSKSVLEAVEAADMLGLSCFAVTDRTVSPVVPRVKRALLAANHSLLPSNSLSASVVLIIALVSQLAIRSRDTERARAVANALEEAFRGNDADQSM